MAGIGTCHLRADALVSVRHLTVSYRTRRGVDVQAVSDVSFDILDGETVGLVGESGCGKSTCARALLQYVPTTEGTLEFDGTDLTTLNAASLRHTRIRLQMVFQDPIASLNPRRTVEDIVGEGLRVWGMGARAERQRRVQEVMESVGLTYDPALKRRPGQFSGGQCQRISIARSLVLEPKVLVCDEPVSALDVSVQAQILNLLSDMRNRYSLTMLFITHDLAVMQHVSDRAVVMYAGRVCEVGTPSILRSSAAHPYTKALLDAAPIPDPTTRRRRETPPASGVHEITLTSHEHPSGCRYRLRCPLAVDQCGSEVPLMRELAPDHYVACHRATSTPD